MNSGALGEQVLDFIHTLRDISEESQHLTRRSFTPEHALANRQVARWMEAAGMSVRIDPIGNVIGRYEGSGTARLPALMLGSHLDTVRNAGCYDGALGVILPIVCIGRVQSLPGSLPVRG